MAVDDLHHRANRPTMKQVPSQNGLDDFDEPTNPDHGPPPAAETLGIETVLIHERGVGSRPGQWRAFEIWTSKSIYAIDGQMLCFGVMDRVTGKVDQKHAFLGARLMGGEQKTGKALNFSHPLPVPGSDAIFQIKSPMKGRYGHTSPVEKVVVRIRVTHAPAPMDTGDKMWDTITQTFRPPPGF
jgi:hypothetical protein